MSVLSPYSGQESTSEGVVWYYGSPKEIGELEEVKVVLYEHYRSDVDGGYHARGLGSDRQRKYTLHRVDMEFYTHDGREVSIESMDNIGDFLAGEDESFELVLAQKYLEERRSRSLRELRKGHRLAWMPNRAELLEERALVCVALWVLGRSTSLTLNDAHLCLDILGGLYFPRDGHNNGGLWQPQTRTWLASSPVIQRVRSIEATARKTLDDFLKRV